MCHKPTGRATAGLRANMFSRVGRPRDRLINREQVCFQTVDRLLWEHKLFLTSVDRAVNLQVPTAISVVRFLVEVFKLGFGWVFATSFSRSKILIFHIVYLQVLEPQFLIFKRVFQKCFLKLSPLLISSFLSPTIELSILIYSIGWIVWEYLFAIKSLDYLFFPCIKCC